MVTQAEASPARRLYDALKATGQYVQGLAVDDESEITDEYLTDVCIDGTFDLNALAAALAALSTQPEGTITIPRPHVPFGPQHVSEAEADASYLREAAGTLVWLRDNPDTRPPWGSNLTETIRRLLVDCATALESGTLSTQPETVEWEYAIQVEGQPNEYITGTERRIRAIYGAPDRRRRKAGPWLPVPALPEGDQQ